jgi:hypothetical protein
MQLKANALRWIVLLFLGHCANSQAQIALSASGGIIASEGVDAFVGGSLACKYSFSNQKVLALNAGRYAMSDENGITNYAIPITVSWELYSNHQKIIPYGILDMGLYILGSTWKPLSKAEGMFGISGGGGLKFNLSNQWFISPAVKFLIVGGSGDAFLATNLMVGVGYQFNKD